MDAANTTPRPRGRVTVLLEMIMFQHTIFALPFALMSALVASDGRISARTLAWILAAMVGARSSAMTFNRIVDAGIDARNPRTARRALPTGQVSTRDAWLFLGANTALFLVAAWQLNRLALWLSPLALFIVWGYSLTKRFTKWAHAALGLALAIAPVGAWVAVTGAIGTPSLWLAAAVLCWVAGFDVIYALQDIDFDKAQGLHSLPARWGPARALMMSSLFHILSVVFLVVFGYVTRLGPLYYLGCVLALVLLEYEHSLVNPGDFSRINAAFFTVNGLVSIGLLAFTALAVYFPNLLPYRLP